MIGNSKPLIPKDPTGPLWVMEIGRVSTTHQDIGNIAASYATLNAFWRPATQAL